MENLDDAYHEYLWGESSPRSFAQKARIGNTEKIRRNITTIRP